MTRPRDHIVSLSDTPYYHVTSRCVRRAYLCGTDFKTGKNYEHRREQIENRIRLLSSIFGIDICAYAVMSNHYHIVLKINPKEIEQLSDAEVIERWTCIYLGKPYMHRLAAGKPLNEVEKHLAQSHLERWRKRLSSISWFMKCLNEFIARQANKEDKCTGHFWESRFKSQALLSEEALVSCMAYVDLNPVRAKMATTPEASDFTSIQVRITPTFDPIKAIEQQIKDKQLVRFDLPIKPLLKFENTIRNIELSGILFDQEEYIQLIDWVGRAVRQDKRGSIEFNAPPILKRLGYKTKTFLQNASEFEKRYNLEFRRRSKAIAA